MTRKLFFFLDQYDFCVLEHKQLLLSPYYSLNAVVVPVQIRSMLSYVRSKICKGFFLLTLQWKKTTVFIHETICN